MDQQAVFFKLIKEIDKGFFDTTDSILDAEVVEETDLKSLMIDSDLCELAIQHEHEQEADPQAEAFERINMQIQTYYIEHDGKVVRCLVCYGRKNKKGAIYAFCYQLGV